MTIDKPQAGEFNAYYLTYISKVPDAGPLAVLNGQIASFEKLAGLSDQQADHRYADGKWSVRELVGHVSDTERMFAYRLVHIARGDPAELPGMDEKIWSAGAPHAHRPMAAIAGEMIAVRRATVALVESLDATALARSGIASTFPVSARALVWILPGHAQHHLNVLRERYGVTV